MFCPLWFFLLIDGYRWQPRCLKASFGNWKLRKNKVYKILGNPPCRKNPIFTKKILHFLRFKGWSDAQNVISYPWKNRQSVSTLRKRRRAFLRILRAKWASYKWPQSQPPNIICLLSLLWMMRALFADNVLKLMPSKPKDDELEILANSISLKSSLLQYPNPLFSVFIRP